MAHCCRRLARSNVRRRLKRTLIPRVSSFFASCAMPNFSRAGAASWLSCGDACAVERAAADPLHGARINAKPGGNLPHALGSSRFVQSHFDSFFYIGGYWRPTESLAFAPSSRKPGTDPLLDHSALEFGKDTHHLKHRLARWRGRIEPLLVQE